MNIDDLNTNYDVYDVREYINNSNARYHLSYKYLEDNKNTKANFKTLDEYELYQAYDWYSKLYKNTRRRFYGTFNKVSAKTRGEIWEKTQQYALNLYLIEAAIKSRDFEWIVPQASLVVLPAALLLWNSYPYLIPFVALISVASLMLKNSC